MEYCKNSSAAETLFQCTERSLGVYLQLLDQSKLKRMPLHLTTGECKETDTVNPKSIVITMYITTV